MRNPMIPICLLALNAVSLPVWAGENHEPGRENECEAANGIPDMPNWAQAGEPDKEVSAIKAGNAAKQ
jgi:hypothetical protein